MKKDNIPDQTGGGRGNAYSRIIEAIFAEKFRPGMQQVDFERSDIEKFSALLRIPLPKNLGDVVYSFRYRQNLPAVISRVAPRGKSWVIQPVGRSKYAFVASAITEILPNANLARTSIPDATPGIIEMYRLVALFAFEPARKGEGSTVAVTAEKHYHLVPPDQISSDELRSYAKNRLELP